MMTACGEIKSDEISLEKKIINKRFVMRYNASEGVAYLRSRFSLNSDIHLHIDCASGKIFPKGSKPKITNKKTEVTKILELAIDTNINVDICGYFEVPLKKIQKRSFLAKFLVEQRLNNASIRFTSSRFTLTGLPIREIFWEIDETEEKPIVFVELRGNRSIKITQDYLNECYNWIYSEFETTVIRELNHA